MNTFSLASVAMVALGVAPAAFSLAPQAPGPVALIAAPWVEGGAAMRAALASGAPILAIADDQRTVVVRVESNATLATLRGRPGVMAIRGDAATCGEDAPVLFEAPSGRGA